MKRFLSILLLSFCINSCDDGEFEIQSFDFSSIPAKSCIGANATVQNRPFFIYYTNNREALFLQIPASNFPLKITPADTPRTVVISSTNKVTYRVYNGDVGTESICSDIPPLSPAPVEEWIATSGVIEIETFENKLTNATTGSIFITGYTHNIKLVNTLFVKGDGNQQLFEELFLGSYVENVDPPSISPSSPIYNCGDDLSYIFQNSGNQVITLNTDQSLFINSTTLPGEPRTALIDGENTKMSYQVFITTISQPQNFFCSLPTVPPPLNTWIAQNGIASETGIIEVTTVLFSPNVYRHTISLRKVTFEADGVTFTFGDLYELGIIETTE